MAPYELKSLNLPRLSGRSLTLFASALENNAGQALLLGRLLRDGGIDKLRSLQLAEPPTMHPLALPAAKALAETTTPLAWAEVEQTATESARRAPFATVRDYVEAYRAGQTTPEAAAERVLAAIADSDAQPRPLRAFIANNREDVLAQARAATERIRAGRPLSLFDGVPVTIKDEVDQVPYPTTVGTRIFGRLPATEDSTVVARLRAKGALLIGKANMHEIGINPNGLNVHYGTVRNPYALDHDPGGSSSGPAAAVAAGLSPVAIGADGGGSIRVPAALCGLVGLKATFGRVSEHGAAPLTWSMGHLGPLTTTVEDAALVYAAIAGPDPHDPITQHQPPVSVEGWNNPDLSGLRLGIYEPWFRHADAQIVAHCVALLDKLATAGATITRIEIPELDEMRMAHAVTILAEMAASMANLRAPSQAFGAATRVSLTLGRSFTAADYLQAQRVRTRALAIFADVFAQVDVVLTPATAVTAPLIPPDGLEHGWSDLNTVTELMRYMIPGNLIGLPAISFPAGYNAQGLPIGMQAMGRHWEEHVLLRVAYAAEQVVERKRPSLYYDLLA